MVLNDVFSWLRLFKIHIFFTIQENVVRDIQSNTEMHELIDEEYDQLWKDRDTARQIFPDGRSKVNIQLLMPVFNRYTRVASEL